VDGKEGVKTFQFLIPRFLPFWEKICLFLKVRAGQENGLISEKLKWI